MFNRLRRRLTDVKTVKQLLTAAEQVARADKEGKPGAEHLVIAALDLPDGSARRVFERVGADPDHFAAALADQHAAALRPLGIDAGDATIDAHLPEPGPPTRIYTSEISAQQLFQHVARAARADHHGLTGAHVIHAAANLEHGTTARTLRHMSIDPHELAAAATAEITAQRFPNPHE